MNLSLPGVSENLALDGIRTLPPDLRATFLGAHVYVKRRDADGETRWYLAVLGKIGTYWATVKFETTGQIVNRVPVDALRCVLA